MIGEIISTIHEQQQMITVEWRIWDFFGLSAKMDRAYESPTFTFMDSTWYIEMFTNGEREFNSWGWMGIYLWKKKSFSRNVTFQLGIREEDTDRDYLTQNFTYRFPKKEKWCGEPEFLERSTLWRDWSRIAPENSVTLFCKIYSPIRETTQTTLFHPGTPIHPTMQSTTSTAEAASQTTEAASQTTETESHTTETESQTTEAESQTTESTSQTTQAAPQATHPENSGFEKLSQDLTDLLLNGEDGDVVLKVKDQDFKVHRAILKARSPVFRAMFGHGMQEAESGVVGITDCNPEAFPDFLRYLYSGQVEELSANKVCDLYLLSDKYDVAELKVKCVQFMMNNMSVDTFFDTITLALWHSEPKLLERATNFFMDAASEIIMKADWLSFMKENHVEANELYMKALKCKK